MTDRFRPEAALDLTGRTVAFSRAIGGAIHDIHIIVDNRHLQTGSVNYSRAAADSNSENVLLIWNNPAIASSYLQHWQSRFTQGNAYESSY